MVKRSILFTVGLLFACAIGARADAPQPMPVRYTWVAAENRRFTDEEIKRLASQYSWIIIEKNHAGYDFKAQDADAKRLKTANPNIHVFMNYLAGLQSLGFQTAFATLGFKQEWFVLNEKDGQGQKVGEKIPFIIRGELHGYFADTSNKAYQAFLESIIIPRLKASSFDGLMYDNFRPPLGRASNGLTPEKLRELQDGLRLLLEETKSQMPAGKLLLFNGITRGGSGGERADRSLEYMKTADAGHDEYFCYIGGPDVFRPAAKVREDIDLLTKYGGENKTLLYAVKLAKSKAIKSESRLAQVKRYCYGCFLMGYVPGHGFIQFRTAATIEQGQLDGNDSAEVHLDLGMPKSAYAADGLLLKREFTKGWVFVNQDSSPREISLPADLVYGGKEFHKGDAYTIPTEDAAFFLKP